MLFDFDAKYALFDMTPVDNQFIQEYLPGARGDDVRVYLYGLMRCYHPEAEMTLARMSHDLGLPEEEIQRAYRYWERKGLVVRVSDDPLSYRYVNVRQRNMNGGGISLDPEYEAFADLLYGVFDNGRRLHGSEIRTCYDWVEELKLPQEAVIMLLKHMEKTKGKNFSIPSAQKVALQMAEEGIRTVEDAEEFLSRDQAVYQGTKAVLRRLGSRNAPSEDQLAMYRKWTEEWGFTPQAVEEACAETARGNPSMGYLDGILQNLREQALPGEAIGESQVLQAREEAGEMRKVLRALGGGGLTEDNMAWYRKIRAVYPGEMVLLAARACGKSGGGLQDVEKMLDSWSQKGILNAEDAKKYIRDFQARSELLMELRKIWGLKARMGARERALVTEWEKDLGFSPEIILLAAESASGTEKPMAYLNKILREYAEKGVRTRDQVLEERQRHEAERKAPAKPARTMPAAQYSQRDYSEPGESLEDALRRMEGGLDRHAGGSAE